MHLSWPTRDHRSAAVRDARKSDGSGKLSPLGQAFVQGVIAAGALAFSWSVLHVARDTFDHRWLLLAALTLFSGLFSIRIPSLGARVSASEAFVFALALLFGPAPATLTVALDGLLVSLRLGKRGLSRTLFNMAEPALSVWISSQCFFLLAGGEPLIGQHVGIGGYVWPLVALTTIYFVLNSGLIACAVGFETRTSPAKFLRSAAPHLSLNYVASLCLVVLVVQQAENLGFALAGVVVPLLLMSYVSSRTSIARMEDTNRHLAHLNSLYLSMVETLALAIDAKDQVTHGHIRRVQRHTVALARALGVKDELEIKALEAAGLLHDLGKLAVPDYILNKPGRLTPVEFEQMKTHASVGANILSTIEFPYPVTPVVRHHHEQWDGAGYPDGLRGESIPLGARILAVVDCFDALTSDRPYRRRLQKEEALEYLRSERGRRYDPRVVDRFVEIHSTLPHDGVSAPFHDHIAGMVSPALLTSSPPVVRTQSSATDGFAAEDGALLRCLEQEAFEAAGRAVVRLLRADDDNNLCVVYRYDSSAGELVAAYVSSEDYAFIRETRIPLGDRLSGWVGANRQTVVNSDPALDLGELIEYRAPRLRKSLSTALVCGDTLIGVLTLYSPDAAGFSDEQSNGVERVVPVVAAFLTRSAGLDQSDRSTRRSTAQTGPSLSHSRDALQAR